MRKLLADRVALITGASRGIGAAVARRYAAEGAHVILIARTVGGLEEVDDAVKGLGGSATLLPLDLADGPRIDQIGPSIHQGFGRLQIFVGHAATLGPPSPMGDLQAKDWGPIIAFNLHANSR